MGEAKRRRESDPNFGKKKKASLAQQAMKVMEKMSTLEMLLWTLILVSSVTTVIWSIRAS
ncbi:MAG: hypothetical protein HC810_07425 [Acaryochloridaceae cyanobacterium RL_2_7]|nr:hypothetical protein [Acaryochloridaceae cyanobacterium RL_2_7]